MVRYYKGVDGLKTGYTSDAGYCLTTTAKKDNMRLITVVMNEPSSTIRNSETTTMLDYGFNKYTINNLIATDMVVESADVRLGEEEKVNIVPIADINVLSLKSESIDGITYDYKIDEVKAPVKVGDIVGSVDIVKDGKILNTIDLTVSEDIDKVNFLIAMYRNLKDIVAGNI